MDSLHALKEAFLFPINFCPPQEVLEYNGWLTDPTLRLVTFPRHPEIRLPFAIDLFDQASAHAQLLNVPWFAVGNSDILLTLEWQKEIEAGMKGSDEVLIFPRTDFDRDPHGTSPRNLTIHHRGQDLFVCKVETWERIRRFFQNYFLGEAYWDNIFTALFLTHAKGFIYLNPMGLCLHERHERRWGNSPFHYHNRLLANGPDMISTLRWKYFHHGWMLRREEAGRLLHSQEIRQLIEETFITPMPEEVEFAQ
ncbi:MAG: hypothetical protein V4507_06905, partial [Verrucomicrobiota bacterium]